MAALPKRKPSSHRQGRRRRTQKISLPKLVTCPKCGHKKLPHLPCPHCGWHEQKTKRPASPATA